ncbi:MAG: PRC-barrel domain-containing protein [Candidatus Thorarchaeota archaeon]|jgi:sporulation protein YlmC with PRC-barrel domain
MILEISQPINTKTLQKSDVVDSNGDVIGRINDLTFTFDGKFKLSKFILAGSKFEEFLESIRVRPDRDPVFHASLIKSVSDRVHLDTTKNSLKTTLDEGAIDEEEIRFSDLKKMQIVDKNGEKVGKALEMDFDEEGKVCIVAGGSFIEEKLEDLGIKTDIDILVPGLAIESIDDEIKLSVSKNALSRTLDETLKKVPDMREAKGRSRIRAFAYRPL